MYDYGIIDAQYLLRRNKVTIERAGQGHLIKGMLIQSFINSIMKLKRENDFMYPILCWDKSPYFKTSAILEYKKDRHHATTEEVDAFKVSIDDLKKQLEDPTVTDEKRKEIEDQIKQFEADIIKSELEMENFKVFQSVKYDLIGALSETGFKSMIKSGYEADDLGYMLANRLKGTCKTGILLTVDKDWIFFQNENVIFRSIKYPDKTYSDLIDPWHKVSDKVTLYEYGILYEILQGSHNNVSSIDTGMNFQDSITRLLAEDKDMPCYEDLKAYYTAMNMNYRLEDNAGLISHVLNPINHNVMDNKLRTYCMKNLISLNFSTYDKYCEGFNRISYDPNYVVPLNF